jgi:transcriptional regulator with XRE-family HTH domain
MSTLKQKLSARLRVIRAERGLSQENVAEMLNLSLNGYSKIERGETDVSLGKVEELARVLNVEVAELLQLNTTNTYINQQGHAHIVYSQGAVHQQLDRAMIDDLDQRLRRLEQKDHNRT